VTASITRSTAAQRLLRVGRIYAEPEARESARGQQILANFPDAEIVEVDSHWKIPELHGNAGNVERWSLVFRGFPGATMVRGAAGTRR
jgi:hypothetical protein